jgi:esterase/lipase superfamily enzyme
MPNYWMISNRKVKGGDFSAEKGDLAYYVCEKGALDKFSTWKKRSKDDFSTALKGAADDLPALTHDQNEDQRHVTLFVHGYNVGWKDAARRYGQLCNDLYSGNDGLGICVAFDWPSAGSVLGYLPDRSQARATADDLASVLADIYDWLLVKQKAALANPKDACKAKVSIIAHSMGNYVMQKAMASAWSRKNQPLLASLVNQLVMVAADVDNDIFEEQSADASDGAAISNLTYRVTALYSGRDAVLGASAGLKHFGTRRLGRSGLANDPPLTRSRDNIWEVDCSSFFPDSVSGMDVHSAYFEHDGTIALMRQVLRGIDRTVLATTGVTKGDKWPPVTGAPATPASPG